MKLKNYDFFYTKINDASFQKDIIDIIDESDDVQKRNTNVKAKMTHWQMQDEPGFKTLASHILNFANMITEIKHNRQKEPFYFNSMWGICYENQDYTVPHDHWPSIWSCVYYICPPNNCGELIFPELNQIVFPEDKLLVLFPGWMVHEVPKKNFLGKRYTVSANLGIVPYNTNYTT